MADPFTVAGLALGGVSIFFQVYSGIVQGVQLMLDVKNVPDEYRAVYLELQLEQGRLLSWGHAFGFVKDDGDDSSSLEITIPAQVRYMVQDHIEPLWGRIQKFTSNIPHFEQSQEANGPKYGFRFRLNSKYKDLRLASLKLKDRIIWAHFTMKDVKDLVENVRNVNNSVISMSEVKTQREIHEKVQATWMGVLDLQNTIGDLKGLIAALAVNSTPELGQAKDLLRDLAKLKELRAQSHTEHSIPEGDGKSLKLAPGQVHLLETSTDPRWEAKFNNKTGYWVEFKECPRLSQIAHPAKDDIERLVVCELVGLLDPKLSQSFRVPRCIGYYEEGSAFGLVFQKPTNETSSIIPLSDCLQPEIYQPDLGARVALARAVAETVYQLHAVNWLHKALRADNILLFQKSDNTIAYAEPQVSGFELARPTSQPNLTQEPDAGGEDDDYYRDPRNQLCNPSHREYSYCKDFDLYSLGILLIEIALWSPIKTEVSVASASEVKEAILGEGGRVMNKVRFAMGRSYAEAVLACLSGLGSAQDEAESYTVTFERRVVRKIRGIALNG